MDYKHAVVDGNKIFYHERGTGEPLVLIMGFGADGTVWEKHVSVYEKHFRCIVPDNRGVGRSDQPKGPYTTKMMAADTIAVMDHAGVKQARIAGISMGGAIAQEIAINYPERVKTLLLVSTWARFNNYASMVYENLKHVRASVSPEHFMELLLLWIFASPYYENHLDELKRDAASAATIPSPQTRNGFEGQLDACIHHNSVDRLHTITAATLVTVGQMDIFTPPEFSEVLHKGIANSKLSTFPAGGHVHHWEDLERFNKETLTFLLNN
jgi:pimeloyl-ACP methyl ester carboxylesterase